MKAEKRERWMDVCAQIADEQDPKKMIELVTELTRLLEEKEKRLGIIPPKKDP
jgi:hypothetical protein